jgi:hypothetical protein
MTLIRPASVTSGFSFGVNKMADNDNDNEIEPGEDMTSEYARELLHTTNARLSELREQEAAIRVSYADSEPIDESELEGVLTEIDDLTKIKKGLEHKFGHELDRGSPE